MTARRSLQQRLQKLQDVREILASMKNLAYMETRKLATRMESQRQAVGLIEQAAADFLAHFPEIRAELNAPTAARVQVVVGSERGFCGGFNERLRESLSNESRILAVGRKLVAKLEADPRFTNGIDGAMVTEETDAVLERLVQALGELGAVSLTVVHHDEYGEIRHHPLLPPFRDLPSPKTRLPFPPELHLEPHAFFLALVDQYLFAVLQEILFASLLAENEQRVRHLEGAVQRLDEQLAALKRRQHQLRQEEIIEEIEIILLNAEGEAPD